METGQAFCQEQVTGASIFIQDKNLNTEESIQQATKRDSIPQRAGSEEGETCPIVLVPNDTQKSAIDQVTLKIASIFRNKIIDLLEPLAQEAKIFEPGFVEDSIAISEILGKIAKDPKDAEFLQKFAFTQMFSFLLQERIVL